jgi:hypothetical protein
MICKPCTKGDHCGKPGERTTQCTCQHRHPGAWKGVRKDEGS